MARLTSDIERMIADIFVRQKGRLPKYIEVCFNEWVQLVDENGSPSGYGLGRSINIFGIPVRRGDWDSSGGSPGWTM